MTSLFYSHPVCQQHVTPAGHPEQVARLKAVEDALRSAEFLDLARCEAPLGDEAHVLLAHPPEYLERIKTFARKVEREGGELASDTASDTGSDTGSDIVALDGDTFMSSGSYEAALRSIGGNVSAIDEVMAGGCSNAFVACRPPGHHAETQTAMGFCLFSTVAIAARYACETYGLERVAVLDFDVHHGNGTQDVLWDEHRVRFVSSHQMPLYPGTGTQQEQGAHGQIVNLPLEGGTDGAHMRAVWDQIIEDVLVPYAPQLVLVSAGFDAHRRDHLAGLEWETDDFSWLAHRICDLAEKCCSGRVVSTLEGGYDLEALGESVGAYINVMMERGA